MNPASNEEVKKAKADIPKAGVPKPVAPKAVASKAAASKAAAPKAAVHKAAVLKTAVAKAAVAKAAVAKAGLPKPGLAKAVLPAERRRKPRFPLGLPVVVHLAGHAEAETLELIDLSASGGRFRVATGTIRLNQAASFSFLLPGQRRCQVNGRVVRTDGAGEFALRFQEANTAFIAFVAQLAG